MSMDGHTLSPVKAALVQVQVLRARLEAAERARVEPIAIVGMGCRFPGGVSGPERLWELLARGGDAVTSVPRDRWDAEAFFDLNSDRPGTISSRAGGFIDTIDRFDASFFGITPREAALMDPQQRLLLEVAWEALEHGGLAPDRLMGSRTGVFIGLSASDYLQLELRRIRSSQVDAYLATGGAQSVAAGRLAHVLGLQGPCLVVDTACSSSLVALHLALQSLRSGESDLALAGGASELLLPEFSVNFSRAGMLASDGRCKTFDARADGYVRSEGCGIVVLKRLTDAVAAGDRITALIRGSAVNQDGRSSGLTVPNGPAQEAVIREALRRSDVLPDQIDYVEAHGTGTALGDPIELGALGAALTRDRAAARPVIVGSIKTNLGHLESAAGIAGLMKVALALEHGQIPEHLHFEQPTPLVDWQALRLRVPTSLEPWPSTERPRMAAVSSFGFSGTNAHAILQQADTHASDAARTPPTESGAAAGTSHVLTVSARTPLALRAAVVDLQAHLASHPDQPIADVCHTRNAGRAHFAHRLAFVVRSVPEADARLREWLDNQLDDSPTHTEWTTPPSRVAIAMVFGDISRAAALIEEAELWKSWGLVPDVVVGEAIDLIAADPSTSPFWRQALREIGSSAVPPDECVTLTLTGSSDHNAMMETLAALYRRGAVIDWRAVAAPFAPRRVSLPTYPFQREVCWFEARPGSAEADSARWQQATSAAREQSRQAPLDLHLASYAAKQSHLERMTTASIIRACHALEIFVEAESWDSADSIIARHGIDPRYRRLIGRWLDRLSEHGLIHPEHEGFRARQPLPDDDLPRLIEDAGPTFAEVPVWLDYVGRCGMSLAAVLTGRTSPLDLLFPDGSSDLAEQLYGLSPSARYLNAIVRAALAGWAETESSLQVLEIGAGTGSTTRALLPALEDVRFVYTFTDVAGLLIDRARRAFAGIEGMRYAIFDLEQAPGAQSLTSHQADVVVAANAVHAVRNLDDALRHAREVLAPGGLLVLLESTTHPAWYDISIGLVAGWQRFEDGWRGDHPLLTAAQWGAALSAHGFVAVEAFPDEESPAAVVGQRVILAQAPRTGVVMVGADIRPADADQSYTTTSDAPIETRGTALLEELRTCSADERRERVIALVSTAVARVMGIDAAAGPDRRARLMDFGVDSLMAVELRNQIVKQLGITRRLPASLLFDAPTPEAMAAWLEPIICEGTQAARAPDPDRAARTQTVVRRIAIDEIAGIDDDEVETLLNARLERM